MFRIRVQHAASLLISDEVRSQLVSVCPHASGGGCSCEAADARQKIPSDLHRSHLLWLHGEETQSESEPQR